MLIADKIKRWGTLATGDIIVVSEIRPEDIERTTEQEDIIDPDFSVDHEDEVIDPDFSVDHEPTFPEHSTYYEVIQSLSCKGYDLMVIDSNDNDLDHAPLGYDKRCIEELFDCLKIRHNDFMEANYIISVVRKQELDTIITYAKENGYKPPIKMTQEEIEEKLGYKIIIL